LAAYTFQLLSRIQSQRRNLNSCRGRQPNLCSMCHATTSLRLRRTRWRALAAATWLAVGAVTRAVVTALMACAVLTGRAAAGADQPTGPGKLTEPAEPMMAKPGKPAEPMAKPGKPAEPMMAEPGKPAEPMMAAAANAGALSRIAILDVELRFRFRRAGNVNLRSGVRGHAQLSPLAPARP
jgi:hypothetical protein